MPRKKPREYDYTVVDEELDYLYRQIASRFSALKSLLTIDEVNILGAVNDLYAELGRIIRKVLLAIAQYYYGYMWEDSEKEYTRWLDEQWIEDVLTGYDPMSKYIFVNEEDRKRARLVEALMASSTPAAEADAAAKSLGLMYRIYAVRVADEAAVAALRDQGVDLVMWLAERDNRTCEICWERDKKIYPITDLPDKPHINCRCTVRSVSNVQRIEYAFTRNRGNGG